MADLFRFIVNGLNGPPFRKGLTLVTFDELDGFELKSLLNEILVHLDPAHDVELRDESPEATGNRVCSFLRVLKYRFPSNASEFRDGLGRGERSAVYPVLHWILSQLAHLEKRAYLARFLVPVVIPPAFQHDESIKASYSQCTALQAEFKAVHKEVDKLRKGRKDPDELKREIEQLQDEKAQLQEKIKQLKRKTEKLPSFEELFMATSMLRQEQEEEAKLHERKAEQSDALMMSADRLEEIRRRVDAMRSAQRDDSHPERLLRNLEEEVRSNRALAERTLAKEMQAKREQLAKLQSSLMEPAKSQEEVQDLERSVDRAEREIIDYREKIERASRKAGDDKLKLFRQQSAMIAGKLQEKIEELDGVKEELEELDAEVASKSRMLAETSGGRAGGGFARKADFDKYAMELTAKSETYKDLKKKLAAVHAESVILHRTEAILKSRCEGAEEFVKSMEATRGVSGFSDVESGLKSVSKATAEVNSAKGKTLEEMSRMVALINKEVKAGRKRLQPAIDKLKAIRAEYKEVHEDHNDKKAVYDNTAAGFESERVKLEQECDGYQEDCLRVESRYHYLQCLSSIARVHLERVDDEAKYESGDGRLLRDFKTYKELYTHKIQNQEQMAKELRRRQKALRESAGAHAEQNKMFASLRRLLSAKLNAVAPADSQSPSSANASAGASGAARPSQGAYGLGGANIFTIEQAS